MAQAVRRCKICRKIFPANRRRKTCSDECHSELTSRTVRKVRDRINTESEVELVKTATNGGRHWEPSQEYIREQCNLIRSGLIRITRNGDAPA